MKKTIKYECECSLCNGTGLYVGMAEEDGSAVVCHHCKGTGRQDVKIIYNTFTGKKNKKGIKRVFQTNPGIGIGKDLEEGKFDLSDFGGISYEDWKKGKGFTVGTEMRKYVCPGWWYQTADCKKKPEWKECILGRFSSCSSFKTKEKCWQRWDLENGNCNISDLMKSNIIDPVLIQREIERKIENEKKNNTV